MDQSFPDVSQAHSAPSEHAKSLCGFPNSGQGEIEQSIQNQ
jgi:hypothetical protein